jgi:hypothetical protein
MDERFEQKLLQRKYKDRAGWRQRSGGLWFKASPGK